MLIDLSVPLNNNTPVYPGDPPLKIETTNALDQDGFTAHRVTMGSHVGTHIDAPMHMLKGGKALDQMPLQQFIGAGKCINVQHGFEPVKHVALQPGDIVLLHTGMGSKFHDPMYFKDYPVMPPHIAEYLVEAQVKMVGVDTCSVDNQAHFPVHKKLLGAGILIIEGLSQLDKLPTHAFEVYALPLRLQADASPARVVARW